MSRVAPIIALMLICSTARSSDNLCPTSEPGLCLTVAQLNAATIALARFIKEQPKADARNVFVSVLESDKEFKVSFSPKQNPSELGHDGDTDYITMDNPRGNQYGSYVEYRISKKTRKIIGETYAR